MIPPRIKDVEVLDNYVLKIIYANGEKKIFDMKKRHVKSDKDSFFKNF